LLNKNYLTELSANFPERKTTSGVFLKNILRASSADKRPAHRASLLILYDARTSTTSEHINFYAVFNFPKTARQNISNKNIDTKTLLCSFSVASLSHLKGNKKDNKLVYLPAGVR
jgi:hypothetical protein